MPPKKTTKKTFDSPEDFDEFMSETPAKDDEMETFEEEEEEKPAPKPSTKEDAREEMTEPYPEDEGERDMLGVAADVPVQVVAVMGKKNITIKELSALKMGEVIELGRPANEIVDLVAGGKLIAKGELVEIEGKLGVKVVKMVR
jgi:type III secretion system YscQ/HrcQ family protein